MKSSCESYTFQGSLLGQGLSTEGLERRPFIPHWFRDQFISVASEVARAPSTFQVQFSFCETSHQSPITWKVFGESLAGKRSKTGLGCLPLFLSVTGFWLQPALLLTNTVKIQLLVFPSISLSSFRNTGVRVNIYRALTPSCHNPCGKSVKIGLCTSWHSSLAPNFVRHKSNSLGVYQEITLSHLNLQVTQKLLYTTSFQ